MIKNSEKSIKIDVMNSLLIDDANFVTFFTRGCFVAPRAEIPVSPLMVSCPLQSCSTGQNLAFRALLDQAINFAF